MMRMPLVSVLMPVYNAERYVAEAVESILGQTFADFEFIIIDDGSKDRSLAILEGYAARDPRIRLISRPNTGIVQALNEGLALARGELVARMDADDIAMPERLARQVEYLAEHPECVMVGSRVLVIDPDGMPLTIMGDALTHEQIVDGFLAGRGQLVYHPAVMYRKRVVLDIGAYRDIFDEAEDLDLFLRLAEVGRIVNIEEPLLKYREHLAKAGRAKVVRVEENSPADPRGRPPQAGPGISSARELPESSSLSRRPRVFRTWGWWALMSGNVAMPASTRSLAWPGPLSILASWKLLHCAIRGR